MIRRLRRLLCWLTGHRLTTWIYGTCRDRRARKHRWKGNVQFVIWKAGEQGHAEDYWIDMNEFWWPQFVRGSHAVIMSDGTEREI